MLIRSCTCCDSRLVNSTSSYSSILCSLRLCDIGCSGTTIIGTSIQILIILFELLVALVLVVDAILMDDVS